MSRRVSLLALQRDFCGHLTDAPATRVGWADARMASGLRVYHNAYRVQLSDCLAETYARTHSWLGGEAFVAAARAHIETWPPTGWTLGDYGARFADTLAERYLDDPEVAELARLEWLLSRAFEGADAPALSIEAMVDIDWDHAHLTFVPSLKMVPVRTNVAAICSALAQDILPPAAALLPEPGTLLVWRQDFTPCFRTIETIEHDAITMLSAGASFAALCEMLVAARGESDGIALAGTMLGQWFQDGLISAIAAR